MSENEKPVDRSPARELLALCPIFKDEVYRRSARIGTITALGAGGLLAGMLWFAGIDEAYTVAERLFCAAGVGLFTGALVHQIRREGGRHAGAKLALIRIERALGVFEPGRYLPNEALYPEEWKVPPPPGRAITVPSLVLVLFAALFIVEMLIAG
jgi:hypothetical protein